MPAMRRQRPEREAPQGGNSFRDTQGGVRVKHECVFYIVVYFKMAALMSTERQPAQADSEVSFLYTLKLL